MEKLSKELTEHILLKSFVTSRSISGAKRVLEQKQINKDESGLSLFEQEHRHKDESEFSSTSTQVTTNYQTVTSTHDQTTYIVLTSVCAVWKQVLISVSQTKLLRIHSLRSHVALARSNLGK